MISTIKKIIPKPVRRYLNNAYRRWKAPKWKGDTRIFCLSFQRTGTTSMGDFFEHFGYPRAGHLVSKLNQWSKKLYEGRVDEIFVSKDFLRYQMFEDNPWWRPGFYEILYERFPDAKFVLTIRDSKAWFESMKRYSGGKSLGNTRRHARIYQREEEFNLRLKNDPDFKPTDDEVDNLLDLEGMDEHYIRIYEQHIEDTIAFFNKNAPGSLIVVHLEDKDKWQKIGDFIGFSVPGEFDMHSNRSYPK